MSTGGEKKLTYSLTSTDVQYSIAAVHVGSSVKCNVLITYTCADEHEQGAKERTNEFRLYMLRRHQILQIRQSPNGHGGVESGEISVGGKWLAAGGKVIIIST